ncbi:hypothetical protein [Bacillus taeanensis]|uniref:Uncharacterized protein n=1 Tax=Bacillus taeanensis TaxID=273032 RepID=A0A366XW41_9BACI|nr:hypothetical protein [Bacillus taeanensis]RBW68363.1 hypothetical protein DS031_17000 [Bacillus taeanensis]
MRTRRTSGTLTNLMLDTRTLDEWVDEYGYKWAEGYRWANGKKYTWIQALRELEDLEVKGIVRQA